MTRTTDLAAAVVVSSRHCRRFDHNDLRLKFFDIFLRDIGRQHRRKPLRQFDELDRACGRSSSGRRAEDTCNFCIGNER